MDRLHVPSAHQREAAIKRVYGTRTPTTVYYLIGEAGSQHPDPMVIANAVLRQVADPQHDKVTHGFVILNHVPELRGKRLLRVTGASRLALDVEVDGRPYPIVRVGQTGVDDDFQVLTLASAARSTESTAA